MSITHHGLPVSTHQVPNTKRSSSAYSKFVIASSHLFPFSLQSELNVKLKQHSFENRSRQCSGGRALDLQQKVDGSNPGSCWHIFFLDIVPFGHTFLLSTFETAVTRDLNHLWRRDSSEIKCPSSGNSNIATCLYKLYVFAFCNVQIKSSLPFGATQSL